MWILSRANSPSPSGRRPRSFGRMAECCARCRPFGSAFIRGRSTRCGDNGTLEQLSRGLYRLAELAPLSAPDLVAVAKLVPSAVICLISALSLHELTTEIPHEIHVALARGAATPRVEHPPLRVFRFSEAALAEGIEIHVVDGCELRVYSAAKTVADCFKFRNKLGIDVALHGLKRYLESRSSSVDELMRFAHVCRVTTVMRPYVEALL
jgi:predicted transcriptional regulator of viral defense system